MRIDLDNNEVTEVVNALERNGNTSLANRISALIIKQESRKIVSESPSKPVSFPDTSIGYGGTTKSVKESDHEA